jgi:hypothetical protein
VCRLHWCCCVLGTRASVRNLVYHGRCSLADCRLAEAVAPHLCAEARPCEYVPPLRARALARVQFSVSRPVLVWWSSVRRGSTPSGVCCDVPVYMYVSLARALAHVPLCAVLLCTLGGAAPAHIIFHRRLFAFISPDRSRRPRTQAGGTRRCGATGSAVLTALIVAAVLLARSRTRANSRRLR